MLLFPYPYIRLGKDDTAITLKPCKRSHLSILDLTAQLLTFRRESLKRLFKFVLLFVFSNLHKPSQIKEEGTLNEKILPSDYL
jgi:hypothetical protein